MSAVETPVVEAPLRVRKWEVLAGHSVSIRLTRAANGHADDVRLHAAIKGFVDRLADPSPRIPDVQHAEPIRYRGYRIFRNDFTAHPDWREVAWVFTHEDYDGPEDNRHGHAATVEACIFEIDEQVDG